MSYHGPHWRTLPCRFYTPGDPLSCRLGNNCNFYHDMNTTPVQLSTGHRRFERVEEPDQTWRNDFGWSNYQQNWLRRKSYVNSHGASRRLDMDSVAPRTERPHSPLRITLSTRADTEKREVRFSSESERDQRPPHRERKSPRAEISPRLQRMMSPWLENAPRKEGSPWNELLDARMERNLTTKELRPEEVERIIYDELCDEDESRFLATIAENPIIERSNEVYSKPKDLTEEEMQAFKAMAFQPSAIPMKPPPEFLC